METLVYLADIANSRKVRITVYLFTAILAAASTIAGLVAADGRDINAILRVSLLTQLCLLYHQSFNNT